MHAYIGLLFLLSLLINPTLAHTKIIFYNHLGFEVVSSKKVAQCAITNKDPYDLAFLKAEKLCAQRGLEFDKIDYLSFENPHLSTLSPPSNYKTFVLSLSGMSEHARERRLHRYPSPSVIAAKKLQNLGMTGLLVSGFIGTPTAFYYSFCTDYSTTAIIATSGACLGFLLLTGTAKLAKKYLKQRDSLLEEDMPLLQEDNQKLLALPILATAIHCIN